MDHIFRSIGLITSCAVIWLISCLSAGAAGFSVNVQSEDGSRSSVELYSQSHALVVGIDNYRNGWPRLSSAVRDARIVASTLEGMGYDVTLVLNPDRENLVRTMREFFIVKGNDPNARLFMWFAGHGHTENDEGFIIPADASVPEAGPNFRLSAIPLRDLSTYVRLAQAKHVLSVFDSCFAGTVFDTRRAAMPRAITQAVNRPVRHFLTSGDAYQQVSDDGMFQELFTRLLTGTENGDMNRDGYVTATELGLYISDRMTNLTEGRQTPRYGKIRDRNFDLGEYVVANYNNEKMSAKAEKPNQTQMGTLTVDNNGTTSTSPPPQQNFLGTIIVKSTGTETITVPGILDNSMVAISNSGKQTVKKPTDNVLKLEQKVAVVKTPEPKKPVEPPKHYLYAAVCGFSGKNYTVRYDSNSAYEALKKAKAVWGRCDYSLTADKGYCISMARSSTGQWAWRRRSGPPEIAEEEAIKACGRHGNSSSSKCKIVETVCTKQIG